MSNFQPEESSAALTARSPVFATTRWSVVVTAGRETSESAEAALEQLCRAYWYPLYAYVRRRGYGVEDAQDLTQSFFARLLQRDFVRQADPQRGKFRTYLLTALNHFLADEWDRANRLKRGGGLKLISIDAAAAEERYRLEPADLSDPARLYERRWATTVLERALTRLEREYLERGQESLFAAMRPFLLVEQGDDTLAAAAERLNMSGPSLKMAASRMRARCRDLLREEIVQTAIGSQDAEEEFQALRAALRG